MKKIWVVLLVLGMIMFGAYCPSAESGQSMEASDISVLQNVDENNKTSLAKLEMEDVVNSEIQMEDEDQGDDEGDEGDEGGGDEGGGDEDEGEE